MELRDYQKDVVEDIYTAWNSGAKNVLVQLATGGGKTALFSKILSDHRGVSLAIAHRVELVGQISLTLGRYGVYHSVIAQKPAIRNIIGMHMAEYGKNYIIPGSSCTVAGIDTLIKLDAKHEAWFNSVSLVVQDEGHHPLRENKWGKIAVRLPNARGLYPTATPIRADGKGLGRHADGIIDALIVGPSMRDLIRKGYLTDYRIFAPPNDINLLDVPISAGGDYSPPKLRNAVHKSHVVGDVVKHYLKIAPGKLGVTFAVDIESAIDIAKAFRDAGVKAEVITGKTPDMLRAQIMARFRRREILQIVNVDILGEGVDVPAIEVVSMARPTQSFALYSQSFGRALRPMPGKSHAIIIDHVGNVVRHGLPDAPRTWSLDRRDKRAKTAEQVIPLRTCLNELCMAVYERIHKKCPECGHYPVPTERSRIENVDGDLSELNPDMLARLRGEIDRIDGVVRIPGNLDNFAKLAVIKRHDERQRSQAVLRVTIAQWAGYAKAKGQSDCEIYRRFYFTFGVDIGTAQTLNSIEANKLNLKVLEDINGFNFVVNKVEHPAGSDG